MQNLINSKSVVVYSHCHLDFKTLTDDLSGVLSRAKSGGVHKMLTIGTNYRELNDTIYLSERYAEIFFALILGWIFFREWPVDQLFPGALFIVAGGIIIYLRQKNSIKTRDRKA